MVQTEEEQLALFRRWWEENGRALVVGVVLAVGVFFGWESWQGHQQNQSESASELYTELMEQMFTEQGAVDTTQLDQSRETAEMLRDDYGSTFYGQSASLMLAKIAVEQNDLPRAQQELEMLLQKNLDDTLRYTAKLRLARVLSATGEYEKALAQTREDVPQAFVAAFAEVRGDVLALQGHKMEARKAYQEAIDNLSDVQGNRLDMIKLKMDEQARLQVAEQSEDEAVNEAAGEAAIETSNEKEEG